MTLRDAIDRYVAWRRNHGAKFETNAQILDQFCREVGPETSCDEVSDAQIHVFLVGNGAYTGYRAAKYGVLDGFYRFAISRGHAAHSPLPMHKPRRPASVPPHIFTREELRRLFRAVNVSRVRAVQLDAASFRMLLLLLYGAGLRRGEAQRLTMADVDLRNAVLTIRDTKFYKNRLVPAGPDLAKALRRYAADRAKRPLPNGLASAFLANRDGSPLKTTTIDNAFRKLLRTAGVQPTDATCRTPSPHVLRHAFATHRLTEWYRAGADVQRLLPALSAFLGHASPAGTQVYLSMTPELLREASLRFEHYTDQHRKEILDHD
ncbi:MAG: tyrosine-type recombinase/integrase [Rhodobacteraceae bacterium]|nr:tyrosine-type recombinase/integrase [Paracoccaceae bacterium]